jgi:hypothetical protein
VLGLTAGLAPALMGASPASAAEVITDTSCTNTAQAGTSALQITVDGAGTPNPIELGAGDITLSGATFGIDVPPTVLLAGYGLNLLSVGVNNIPAEVTVTLLGSNTSQGSQTLGPLAVTGTTTITDPTPANKTSGDESATPLSVTAPLPTTTWTPTGGNVGLSLGDSSTTALVGPGGIIAVTFSCTPGVPGPAGCGPLPLPVQCSTTTPVPAVPFSTVTVNAPPTAPVCTNESVSVGITQTVPINLNDNCTDVNGNIDPSTFVVSPPTAGTLTPTGPGTYTYEAPATDPGAPVVLDFTVEDSGGLVSNTGQVAITILANSCDATAAPCSLTEIVVQPVIGTTMTLAKEAGLVEMDPITLNGNSQASRGSLRNLTVTNARGTASPWTLTGFVTDLGAPGSPTITLPTGQTIAACSAAGSLGTQPNANRLCIPGDNMGWAPTAAVAHDVIFGDVAAVAAGPADATDATDWILQLRAAGAAGLDGIGGLQEVNVLCSSPANQSGGTFACDAELFLGVPASAGAGTYTGGLVLTLLYQPRWLGGVRTRGGRPRPSVIPWPADDHAHHAPRRTPCDADHDVQLPPTDPPTAPGAGRRGDAAPRPPRRPGGRAGRRRRARRRGRRSGRGRLRRAALGARWPRGPGLVHLHPRPGRHVRRHGRHLQPQQQPHPVRHVPDRRAERGGRGRVRRPQGHRGAGGRGHLDHPGRRRVRGGAGQAHRRPLQHHGARRRGAR